MYKNIKKTVLKLFAFSLILIGTNSCETTELEILDNPNALAPEQADVNFFLNNMQVSLATYFESITEEGMEVTRILHMFGPLYSNAYSASTFDFPYQIAYAGILADARALRPLANEQELFTHTAISKVIEAYVMISLVDYFGDVPYSEALLGTEFLNPNVDSGADIYAAVEVLLNEAIEDFNKEELSLPNNDLFYDGDEDKWIALVNTLKLKMYVQTRLVNDNTAKINEIVNSGNYITDASGDFQFEYSQVDTSPDSRHPVFAENFDVAADVSDYMSNSYMYYLAFEKEVRDPRTRYYFYRQSLNITEDENALECIREQPPSHYDLDLYPFCYAANFSGTSNLKSGYWGRDHGNSDGIPPDGGERTTWGVYPVGGKFDDSSGEAIPGRTIGLQGAGISPIMLASYVDFMLAESALTEGTTGSARMYLENGIRKSINKVINFGEQLTTLDDTVVEDDPETEENEEQTVRDLFVPTQEDIDNYVFAALRNYDDAAGEDEKLNVIVKEYFIALFGNGVEAYNTYRRTGSPENLQPTLIIPNGGFIRSFLYPSELVDQNSNVNQKPDHTVKVFWDTESATLN